MRRSLAFVWAVTAVLTACGEEFSTGGGGGQGGSSQGGSSSGSGGDGGNSTSSGIGGSPVECPDSTIWAPPVGPGWEGPVIRTRAADEGNLTACPSADGLLLHTGLQGDDPASCFCSCGAPNPESCAVVVNLWGNVNCSGGANDSITLDPGCENANGQTVAGSVKWSSAPPQPGACAVSSDVDLSTPSWAAHMRVCNGETTTVEGEICLATEAGFDAQACVVKEGSVACPAGYPEQRVGFLDFEEGRGCSECTCDTSTASCGGHVTVQTTGLCGSGTAGAVIGPNSCSQLVNAAALTAIAYDPATSGTCAVGGGQPTGLVDKVGAHTVCCTP